MESHNVSYTIAPRSTFDPSAGDANARPMGAAGMEAFRRMTVKKVSKRG